MSDISSHGEEKPTRSEFAPGWQQTSTMDALDALVSMAAVVPQAVARRSGLSTSELHALRFLSEAPRGPVELAHLLGVTSAASSGVVDRLEQRGHVERRAHPDDRRRTQVLITESGRREAFAMLAPMFRGLAEIDHELDESERVVVERFLHGVIDAMRRVL